MEKRVLLAALPAPPCAVSTLQYRTRRAMQAALKARRDVWCWHVSMCRERQGAGLRQTDGNTWLRNDLENSNISGHVLVFTGIFSKKV